MTRFFRALACPASLKGVLGAAAAAAALGEGLRLGRAEVRELPVADGGEGTADVLFSVLGGEWREAEVTDAFGAPRLGRWLVLPDGTAVVEAAEAIPLDPARLDPLAASSRGLGELLHAALDGGAEALLVCLGGSATVDGGAGLLELFGGLPVPAQAACDVATLLPDAPRLFGPQKGATEETIPLLERRLAELSALAPYAALPGSGAAGGLGAALAALGAELRPGAELVLETIGFEPSGYDLVVTGEGTVDRTTAEGKAPALVARRCAETGVRCVVFGGIVVEPLAGAETVALSGDPARAREDLAALGERLARG
ncbi:MAG: glycerate kinase [Actinobacteria bacterium]|nr:glycerate kinase [Actinomycetota bacterium]